MITCKILSTEDSQKSDNLVKVELPSVNGTMQVFKDHAESFIKLQPGFIVLEQKNGKIIKKEISQAECHIKDNVVTVII